MDLYRKVRLACAEGMSQREAARHFNISRDSVAKMMAFSAPPGYRRTAPVKRPKLDAYTGIIDGWLEGDRAVHRKQRHTAKRVFERLRDEHKTRIDEAAGRLHLSVAGHAPAVSVPLALPAADGGDEATPYLAHKTGACEFELESFKFGEDVDNWLTEVLAAKQRRFGLVRLNSGTAGGERLLRGSVPELLRWRGRRGWRRW